MSNLYTSRFEAYPFLSDDYNDFRCDFEIFTDYISSKIGLLCSIVKDKKIQDDLLVICELVYHANATLRTKKFTVTNEELKWLEDRTLELKVQYGGRCKRFVLTQGSQPACESHLLRVMSKALVRLLYRYNQQGHDVPPELYDFANLLSGYFFYLALKLNEDEGVKEIEYISRNYKDCNV